MVETRMTDIHNRLDTPDPRIFCFDSGEDDRAFENSVTSLIQRMQKRSRDKFISDENTLRMNHGITWVHAASDPESDTSMHTISAELTIPFKDIAENDLSLILRTIQPINESMEQQFAQNVYGVIGAAAEKVGNVVDARASGSFANSILEMFRKIELGVDRDGNISMPQIHVGPEMFKRISEELKNVPPEIEMEIERVKAGKIETALNKELERKRKFKKSVG